MQNREQHVNQLHEEVKEESSRWFSRGHLRFKAPGEWFMHHASFSLQKPSYWASCAAILNTLMHLPFQSRTPGKTVTAFHGNRMSSLPLRLLIYNG